MIELIKKHKWKLLISSILTVSPMLFGIIVWEKLPEQLALHWGIDGLSDGFGHPFFAIFFLPIFLLLMHWLCLFITAKDNKGKGQSDKVLGLLFFIMPVLSIYLNGIVYATAFGMSLDPTMLTAPLLGIGFIAFGNYMPKCRRNRTIGIKIKWTLENDENWNATHRFGGKVWVVCGVLALFSIFLPGEIFPVVLFLLSLVAVVVPTVYSYLFHRKQLKEGTAAKDDPQQNESKTKKSVGTVSIVFIIATLLFCGILCLTGNIRYHYNDTSFKIEASFHEDLTVNYDEIEEIEYRETFSFGSRIFGFGTPRLSMGTFKNKEFGEYTLYSYTACKACVVLTNSKDEKLVLGGSDQEKTKAIYEELLARVNASKKGENQ